MQGKSKMFNKTLYQERKEKGEKEGKGMQGKGNPKVVKELCPVTGLEL